MRVRFKSCLGFIIVLIVLMLLLLVSYKVYIDNKVNDPFIKTSDSLSINYKNGNVLKIKGSKSVEISIINDGEEDTQFYIEFINMRNTKGVKYILKEKDTMITSGKLDNYNTIISSSNTVSADSIKNYTIEFESSKKDTYYLEVNVSVESEKENLLTDVILRNNEIKKGPLTQIGTIATEDEGLIEYHDEYETTYYFRGNVQNNYVLINNMYFKIVRINGDESVKLIFDGVLEDQKKYYESLENKTFASSPAYLYLKSWFSNMFGSGQMLSNSKYCVDHTNSKNGYIALNRIKIDNIPSFVCTGDKLVSKVGLLTADEVVYAGGAVDVENTSYYLYNSNITTDSYTLTAASGTDTSFYPFTIGSNGMLKTSNEGGTLQSLRPVITVNKIACTGGDGTYNNPYTLTQ